MSNDQAGVFAQTNEAGANRVIAFRRSADGSLEGMESYETGGAGDGVPHLTSQGSVVLSGDGTRLLVTNAGSGDVSVFAVADDGVELLQTVPSGPAPKSVAEYDGLVYAVNTGDRSLVGFRLADGGLEPLGVRVELGAESDPAQVGFTPDGSAVVVTDRGTDAIAFFPVEEDGRLGEPRIQPSSGQTPYGFAFTGDGTLLVTEAFGAQKGKAAASSYRVNGGTATPVSRSVANGRSEICWAVVSKDERFVFTTNFADGAVSRYAIGPDGSIALEDAVAAASVEGEPGLRDEALSSDGGFLYAIDADAGRIFGWAVAEDGRLDPVGSWGGVPPTVAGLAAS
jgi:6-phosphogluconolactonase (cycloisomerase 2 family)